MKQFYVGLAALLLVSSTAVARQKTDKSGVRSFAANELTVKTGVTTKSTRAASVDELLACPEGSVLSGAWNSEATWTGVQCAELKRPGMSSRYYQYFSDCYQTVNKIHWWGVFNHWYTEDLNENGELDEGEDLDGDGKITQDWFYCGEKADIDPETGEAGKAVDFEIKFYTVGSDGLPGEVVYEKIVSVPAETTGVVRSGTPEEYAQIYEFSAELGETLRLESGFFSVSAVDESDEPACWFSVLTNDAVPGFGMLEVEGEYWGQDRSMCFCLVGNGDYIAKKALKISRLLSPTASSNSKYEKVQVELMNVGTEDIGDARLELYEGDRLLATESIDYTIESFYSYKHTFEQRIDCSAVGTHDFKIRNVTAGDEQIAAGELAFSVETYEAGAACESRSVYEDEHITAVKIGSIDNTSGSSNYSDYTDMKTDIQVGETLELRVSAKGDVYIAAWADWNGNGSFDDPGEAMGYLTESDGFIPVSIAEGTEVKEGEVTLRVMATYNQEAPCGEYYYGETEDYTLVVTRPADAPALTLDRPAIEATCSQDTKTVDLHIGNSSASAELTGSVSVQYALPMSPDTRPVSTMPIAGDDKPANVSKRALSKAAVKAAPEADENTETAYVLKYDRGQYDAIALSNFDEVTYAHYYPSNMLAGLAGMQVSSIDVYLNDVPDAAKVVVYGENTQSLHGDLLAEKAFTPQAQSWNHVVLDAPLTIGDTDLWIGVYLQGFAADEYHIGIDEGPANVGFGDLVNIGDPIWWSMADLGVSSNFCIRANVTGRRTPAISWLTTDKESFAVAAGGQETLAVSLDGRGLDDTLYEALLCISSNDAMTPVVKVPVYLTSEGYSKVDTPAASSLTVYGNREVLTVGAAQDIRSVTLLNLNGMCMKTAASGNRTVSLPLADLTSGVYILSVRYTDGSCENIKVPVVK